MGARGVCLGAARLGGDPAQGEPLRPVLRGAQPGRRIQHHHGPQQSPCLQEHQGACESGAAVLCTFLEP